MESLRGIDMRIWLHLIVCTVFLAPTLSAQPWRVDSTKIDGAAQDSTGEVWGFGHHPNLGLYRWESDGWKSRTVAGVPNKAWPWALALGPDGAVYLLWSDGKANLAVSRHKGGASNLLIQFGARLRDRPCIFVDPGGNIWIMEQGRHIFRVTPQGKAECVYTIADEQFHEDGRPKSAHWAFNPIHATVDGRGRVWFWSDCLAGWTNWASLRGVLVFDGVKFEHHAYIAGVPDKKFSVIEPDDAEHIWLAAADDRLYRIDIDTLTGTPAAQPAPPALRYVHKIFRTGGATYVISGSAREPAPERSGGGRLGVLWRLDKGEWAQVLNGLDMRPESFQQSSRPFLATDGDLWLGTFGGGPWFIPGGERKPALIDWHYDYPLDGSEGLFQLADKRLLILSANQGSIAVKQADLLSGFQSPPEVSTLNPPHMLAADAQGHLWGILAAGDNALSEWDGRSWKEHPVPQTFPAQQSLDAIVDSLGRIWLPVQSSQVAADPWPVADWNDPENFAAGTTTEGVNVFGTGFGTDPVVSFSRPGFNCVQTYISDTQITCNLTVAPDCPGGRFDFIVTSHGYNGVPFNDGTRGMGVQIFDPKQRSFNAFPTYEQALLAQIAFGKDFHLPAHFLTAPRFAPDGRICYYASRDRIKYFDGARWREWSSEEIFGPSAPAFEGALFFDRAGNLAVHHLSKIWEFTAEKGWQVIAPEPVPAADRESKHPRFEPTLPDCAVKHPENVVQDRLGTFWFTAQGQLYRGVGGWCSPQFSPDQHQPFNDSRSLQDALIDPQGNAFLATCVCPKYGEYVILKAQPPLPQTVLRASVDASGNVTLQFATKGQAAAGFTWKIDGGPWSTPTKSSQATIQDVANGTHRVEAAAIDERLQIDLTPAVAAVEIHIDTDALIRALIGKLANPDYSVRDKAVAALVRRASLALPLLQSAREKASPDQRWWIDAAIQQIEESLSTNKKP